MRNLNHRTENRKLPPIQNQKKFLRVSQISTRKFEDKSVSYYANSKIKPFNKKQLSCKLTSTSRQTKKTNKKTKFSRLDVVNNLRHSNPYKNIRFSEDLILEGHGKIKQYQFKHNVLADFSCLSAGLYL